jgi:uncharacterized protein (TIGR02001 family)
MTKILKKAVAGIAAGMMLMGAAKASELPFDVEVGADIFSHYVWRGLILTDDPVLQPSVTLSTCGFSLNVWGSIDMTDINEDMGQDYHMQELDFTLAYDFSAMEGVDMGVGVIYYTFPGTMYDSTQEVYGSVALSMVPYVTPSLTVTYDFDEAEGFYIVGALDSEFALTEKMALGLGASLAYGDSDYNAFYYLIDESGLADLNFSASLSYQVNDNFSVGISAGYMVIVGSDVKDSLEANDMSTNQFFMGVSAGFAF